MIILIYRSIYSCIESNRIIFLRYRQTSYRWVRESISNRNEPSDLQYASKTHANKNKKRDFFSSVT